MKAHIPYQLIFVCLFMLKATLSIGQVSGIASYQIELDLKQFEHSRMTAGASVNLQGELQSDFILHFNGRESLWELVPTLEGGGIEAMVGDRKIVVKAANEDEVLYKNLQNKEIKETRDLLGKLFLISDDLQEYEWVLDDATKDIGQYPCQRATLLMEMTEPVVSSSDANTIESVSKTVEVEAWYTSDIPVGHGPEKYWGLPGLIMEVNIGSRRIICKDVALISGGQLEVSLPRKGKKIGGDEFKKMEAEKMEEMRDRYRGRNGGNVIFRSR